MFKVLCLLTTIFFIHPHLAGMGKKVYLPGAQAPRSSDDCLSYACTLHPKPEGKRLFENALEKTYFLAFKSLPNTHDDPLRQAATAQYAELYKNLYKTLIFLIECNSENEELMICISSDELETYKSLFEQSFTTFTTTRNSDPKYQNKKLNTCMRIAFTEAINELIPYLKQALETPDIPELHQGAIINVFLKIKAIGIPFDLPEIREYYEEEEEEKKEDYGTNDGLNQALDLIKF